MKKLLTVFLMMLVVCSGCSAGQNEESQKDNAKAEMTESQNDNTQAEEAESQNGNTQAEEAESLPPENTADANTPDAAADNSAENIDYGKTANEFLTSAPVDGMVTNLTDSSFTTQPAYAGADSGVVNVVYDAENVRFKTATVQADSNSFSVSDGQRSDLKERASVLVYGESQADGTFKATEIIVVEYN